MNKTMVGKERDFRVFTGHYLRAGINTAVAILLSAVLAFSGTPAVAFAEGDDSMDGGSPVGETMPMAENGTEGGTTPADPDSENGSGESDNTQDGDLPSPDGSGSSNNENNANTPITPQSPDSDEESIPDTPVTPATALTVSGVDFMQPNATAWDVLRVDGLGQSVLYLDVEEYVGDAFSKLIVKRGVYSEKESQILTYGEDGEEVGQIITLNFGGKRPQEIMGVSEGTPSNVTYHISVYTDLFSDSVIFDGAIYPIYAALQEEDGSVSYELLGIRTAAANEWEPKNVGAGDTFYRQSGNGDLETYVRQDSAAGVDNEYVKEMKAYIVTYNKQAAEALTGSIRYVDGDGELIKETKVTDFVNNEAVVRIEDSFVVEEGEGESKTTRYYRALSNLGGSMVKLMAGNTHAVIRVVEIKDMAESNYSVELRYIDEGNNLLWADKVDVKNYGYQYTLPNTFSIHDDNGVELYMKPKVEGPESTSSEDEGDGVNAESIETRTAIHQWEAPTLKFDSSVEPARDFLGSEADGYYLNIRYTSSKSEGEAALRLVAIDGSTGLPFPDAYQPGSLEITDTHSASYTPQAFEIDGMTYVPWSGNSKPITYTWADLSTGMDLLQYVYYVPEGYVPEEAYDVTVQYIDIANGALLRKDTYAISPELSGYMTITSEERFAANGNEYVRLDGQDLGIRHGYYSSARVYTVYYRDVNDVINADTVIRRTQIVETERVVTLPGTTTTTVTNLPGTVTTITSAPTILPPTIITTPATTIPGTTTPPATTPPVATDAPASAGSVPAAPDATTIPNTAATEGGVAPDATVAAPVAPDVPTTEVGVSAGDGAVIINDDTNPLANQSGQSTVEERTIADNETPLAGGFEVGAPILGADPLAAFDHGSRDPFRFAVTAAGAVIACLAAWILIRRNKRKQYSDATGSDRVDM